MRPRRARSAVRSAFTCSLAARRVSTSARSALTSARSASVSAAGAAGEEPALIDFDGAVVGTAPVGRIGRSFARRRLARSIGKLGLAGFDRGRVATLLDAREASA